MQESSREAKKQQVDDTWELEILGALAAFKSEPQNGSVCASSKRKGPIELSCKSEQSGSDDPKAAAFSIHFRFFFGGITNITQSPLKGEREHSVKTFMWLRLVLKGFYCFDDDGLIEEISLTLEPYSKHAKTLDLRFCKLMVQFWQPWQFVLSGL